MHNKRRTNGETTEYSTNGSTGQRGKAPAEPVCLITLSPELNRSKKMDAILFSAKSTMVTMDDAVRHLAEHDELYWEVGFSIDRNRFVYPILGYIHICGGQVEYVVTIQNIIPFSPSHYEDNELSHKVKPAPWLKEWAENTNNCRSYHWKYALVMTHIEPYSYNTYDFQKYGGDSVKKAPQNYIRVLKPGAFSQPLLHPDPPVSG